MKFDDFRADIAAFADDENDILIDRDGQVIFTRNGKEIGARLIGDDFTAWSVEIDGTTYTYKKFISEYLAGLSTFAERLFSKRSSVEAFVDGPATLESVHQTGQKGSALKLLDLECRNYSPFAAKLTFVTADAGFGKTALLREYQATSSAMYLEGKSPFIFWHVDLQGRQLLRLSEALMGDLGDLRISGIYMSGIIRLLHHRLLIIGIDGFDELAAEQGSTDALGALALLVKQMNDQGTLVASSRRTFFDTESYLKRTKLLKSNVASQCEFDQLHLEAWKRAEATEFLRRYSLDSEKFVNPERTYEEIEDAVGGESNPMIARPFLFSYIAKGLLRYGLGPGEFIEKVTDPLDSVAEVIQAFIDREVAQKWIFRDTGEPYLTVEQHMELLSQVAEEMWMSQVDRLSLDIVEAITAALLDVWGLEPERRQQVFTMVRMHVMLVPPPDSDGNLRSFDHPEFRNYFIAFALATALRGARNSNAGSQLARLLGTAQLPDSVARYMWLLLGGAANDARSAIHLLGDLVDTEWRPTFLAANVGTLLPQLLDGLVLEDRVVITSRLSYSGLIFEGTRLTNIEIRNGFFNKTSFEDVEWDDVTFADCELTDVVFSRTSTYRNVRFQNCKIHGAEIREAEEETREYAPQRIAALLASAGILVRSADVEEVLPSERQDEGGVHKLVRRVLRVFRRTTALTEDIIMIKFRTDTSKIKDLVIPIMETNGIVSRYIHHGGGAPKIGWKLEVSLEDLLAADGQKGDGSLSRFWRQIASSECTV